MLLIFFEKSSMPSIHNRLTVLNQNNHYFEACQNRQTNRFNKQIINVISCLFCFKMSSNQCMDDALTKTGFTKDHPQTHINTASEDKSDEQSISL